MDTNDILDACGKIADELAKIIAAIKEEQETQKAMGQPTQAPVSYSPVPGLAVI